MDSQKEDEDGNGCRERERGGGRHDLRTTLIINTNNPRFCQNVQSVCEVICIVRSLNGREASEGSCGTKKEGLYARGHDVGRWKDLGSERCCQPPHALKEDSPKFTVKTGLYFRRETIQKVN